MNLEDVINVLKNEIVHKAFNLDPSNIGEMEECIMYLRSLSDDAEESEDNSIFLTLNNKQDRRILTGILADNGYLVTSVRREDGDNTDHIVLIEGR